MDVDGEPEEGWRSMHHRKSTPSHWLTWSSKLCYDFMSIIRLLFLHRITPNKIHHLLSFVSFRLATSIIPDRMPCYSFGLARVFSHVDVAIRNSRPLTCLLTSQRPSIAHVGLLFHIIDKTKTIALSDCLLLASSLRTLVFVILLVYL